ncbi:MAG: subclass B3 metallo-beta-lactamase [Acidobacteriota bacterium]
MGIPTRLNLVIAILCFIFYTGSVAAQKSAEWQKYLDESNRPVKPFKIVGNVYYVGMNDLASYLIVTKNGMILVDTALEESGPMIRNNIEALGFDPKNVKIILSGHAHFDHVAGHQSMKEATGAKIYATAPDAMIMASGGMKGFFPFKNHPFKPVRVDKIIEDGEWVKLGGVAMQAHMLPGHTEGNTAWTLAVQENGKKYDVLIAPSMSVNPGVRLVDNKEWPGVADAYRESFHNVRLLKCDVFLGPHAGFFDLEGKIGKLNSGPSSNPFVDPQGFAAYIDEMEKKFNTELARQKGIAK